MHILVKGKQEWLYQYQIKYTSKTVWPEKYKAFTIGPLTKQVYHAWSSRQKAMFISSHLPRKYNVQPWSKMCETKQQVKPTMSKTQSDKENQTQRYADWKYQTGYFKKKIIYKIYYESTCLGLMGSFSRVENYKTVTNRNVRYLKISSNSSKQCLDGFNSRPDSILKG